METYRMFERTKSALVQRIETITDSLEKNSHNLRALDSTRDGDMMDDPLMYHLLADREMMMAELSSLNVYLGVDSEIITDRGLNAKETVDIGHMVKLDAKYGDGYEEVFNLTIGTPLDSKYLAKSENPDVKEAGMLVSFETPLAKALLGKKVGDKVKYTVGGATSEVKILGFQISPLVSRNGK